MPAMASDASEDQNAEALQRAELASNYAVLATRLDRPAPAATAQTMVLDTTINGTPTRRLITYRRDSEGRFAARAEELRAVRFNLPSNITNGDLVVLNDLAGATFRYDEARQSIAIDLPDALLTTHVVQLGGERSATDLSLIRPLTGFVLNYSLFGATGGGRDYLSGNAEALLMTPQGVFSTTGLFNSQGSFGRRRSLDSRAWESGSDFVRLDSSWRFVDPEKVRSYTIGDFNSGALGWNGSIRMAGFQMQSAFQQRGDLVTTALPQFSGSAALPSTLDLYVNNMRVFSGQVPAGPFDLQSLPYVSGGEVRMVTTDALGRQTETTSNYYYASGLLKAGLREYSLDVGVPRYDYGRSSFHYEDDVVAAGSIRWGLTNRTTVEGHIEGSTQGLINGGLGFVQAIGNFGAITASGAFSSYDGDTGAKFKVHGEFNVVGVRGFAGTERTTGEYFDLSRLASLNDLRRFTDRDLNDDEYQDWLKRSARATVIDRAGLSFQPWFDPTSISVSYNRINSDRAHLDRSSLRTLNLSASRRLTSRVSFSGTAFSDLDDGDNYGVFARLHVRLGTRTSASVGVDRNRGRTGYSVQAAGSAGPRQGEVSWSVANREYEDGDAWRSGSLGYRAGFGDLRAQVDQTGDDVRVTGEVSGSLVVAGGGVFPANRIGQAFAIVQGAGPGSTVIQGGARIARSDRNGRALLPDLTPYFETPVSIDPTHMPEGWEPRVTETVAVAGYRQGTIVDFGAAPVHGGLIVLVDASGAPIPAGHEARLAGSTDSLEDPQATGVGMVGYDGEVYVRGLRNTNDLTVDLGQGARCTATFDYAPADETLTKIGPVTCR